MTRSSQGPEAGPESAASEEDRPDPSASPDEAAVASEADPGPDEDGVSPESGEGGLPDHHLPGAALLPEDLAPPPPLVPSCVAVLEPAYVGDVVMTSVLARSLRRAFPDAKVLLVARPGPAQLAKGLGFHGAIEFDKRGRHSGFEGIDRVAQRITRRGCDALLVPHRSLRSAVLSWRSKVQMRVGFEGQRIGIPFSGFVTRYSFTHTCPFEEGATFTSRLLSLLSPLRVAPSERRPLFRTNARAKSFVSDLLNRANVGRSPLVALVPGSVWPTKRWPTRSFARLADSLIDLGLSPVVIGAEAERPLFDEIRSAATSSEALVDGMGTSLDQAAELLRRSKVVVAGDSGLLHLGMAVGTRAVALFGPTDPTQHDWPEEVTVLNVDIPCRPCSAHGPELCPEKHLRCMNDLAPSRVVEAVLALLHPPRRRRRRRARRTAPPPASVAAVEPGAAPSLDAEPSPLDRDEASGEMPPGENEAPSQAPDGQPPPPGRRRGGRRR